MACRERFDFLGVNISDEAPSSVIDAEPGPKERRSDERFLTAGRLTVGVASSRNISHLFARVVRTEGTDI